MSLALTPENLDLILKQYETELGKLDLLPGNHINNYFVKYIWYGPRNRFYDVRYDNKYLALNIIYNCFCKCPHHILIKSFYDPKNNHVPLCNECNYKITDFCTCRYFECGGGDEYEHEFTESSCPQELDYKETMNYEASIYDNVDDPFKLRIRPYTDRRDVILVTSIPIIERNLIRLKTELARQENFKRVLAEIRSRPFRKMTWYPINAQGEQVRIVLPRDMLLEIFFWTKI